MIHLTIKMLPASGNNEFKHNLADLDVQVKVGREYRLRDDYSFMVCSESLLMMARATTRECDKCEDRATHAGRTFSMTMHGSRVWIPGKYFFLVYCRQGGVDRFELELDDHCGFTVGAHRRCERLSDEDVLSRELFYNGFFWNSLYATPGTASYRRWILERLKWNAVAQGNNEDNEDNDDGVKLSNNMLIVMNSTDSRLTKVHCMLTLGGIYGKKCDGDCNQFYDPINVNPYHKVDDLFNDDRHGYFNDYIKEIVYIFYNIGAMNGNGGMTALRRLLEIWPATNRSAVFCGTQDEIDALMELNPSLRECFPEHNRIVEEPCTLDEVVGLFSLEVKQANITLSPAAVDKVCRLLIEAFERGNVGQLSAKGIQQYLTSKVMPALCRRGIIGVSQGLLPMGRQDVGPEDIDEEFFRAESATITGLFEELEAMVGLEDIKRSIVTLANRRRFFAQRRQLGLNTSEEGPYHAIFTGNPGTGKTTVAKMMGRIYRSLGLLSRGEVICVDRTTIVGRYIGQTEENMKQIIEQARGNVLLVDEAYTLYVEDDDRDFGRHAVECLMPILSSKHPDMLVIFAGYKQEMDELLSINPGLAGRFPYEFHFKDYSADELMLIAHSILEKDQYILSPEAHAMLLQVIKKTVAAASRTFANARWVSQFIQSGIIPAMADRLTRGIHTFDAVTYQTIQTVDVLEAHKRLTRNACNGQPRSSMGYVA